MLANIKKKLSFLFLSIISIFIFSSCSGEKEIEIKDLDINKSITVETTVPAYTGDHILFFEYQALRLTDIALFVSLKYHENYESYGSFYVFTELPNKNLNDIKEIDLELNILRCLSWNKNYIDKNHSFKIDDEADLFTFFEIQDSSKYYLAYCTHNKTSKPKEIKFDLILYNTNICDEVKPTVLTVDSSDPFYLGTIGQAMFYEINTEAYFDYKLIEFTAAKKGMFKFVVRGALVDYCESIPKGFGFNEVICTYYATEDFLGEASSDVLEVVFCLELEENEIVYFRLRDDNFAWQFDSTFVIIYESNL